jgi:hypothetical protein
MEKQLVHGYHAAWLSRQFLANNSFAAHTVTL